MWQAPHTVTSDNEIPGAERRLTIDPAESTTSTRGSWVANIPQAASFHELKRYRRVSTAWTGGQTTHHTTKPRTTGSLAMIGSVEMSKGTRNIRPSKMFVMRKLVSPIRPLTGSASASKRTNPHHVPLAATAASGTTNSSATTSQPRRWQNV